MSRIQASVVFKARGKRSNTPRHVEEAVRSTCRKSCSIAAVGLSPRSVSTKRENLCECAPWYSPHLYFQAPRFLVCLQEVAIPMRCEWALSTSLPMPSFDFTTACPMVAVERWTLVQQADARRSLPVGVAGLSSSVFSLGS